jgi:hypothetical protein
MLLAAEKTTASPNLRIHKFENVNGRNGFFLAGARPVFVFSERNYMRFHPMTVDGSVDSFTTFNNVNCDHGFIYYNAKVSINVFPKMENPDFLKSSISFFSKKCKCAVSVNCFHMNCLLFITRCR